MIFCIYDEKSNMLFFLLSWVHLSAFGVVCGDGEKYFRCTKIKKNRRNNSIRKIIFSGRVCQKMCVCCFSCWGFIDSFCVFFFFHALYTHHLEIVIARQRNYGQSQWVCVCARKLVRVINHFEFAPVYVPRASVSFLPIGGEKERRNTISMRRASEFPYVNCEIFLFHTSNTIYFTFFPLFVRSLAYCLHSFHTQCLSRYLVFH